MNLVLYGLTVLIWGTTWIGISLQQGPVHSIVSVFYRFLLAGLVLFVVVYACGRLQKTRLVDHLWFVLQGGCLFCFNFICFYTASKTMASGLLSIVFSTAIFFNAVNNRVFWKVTPDRSIFIAGFFGIIGLVLMFWQELNVSTENTKVLLTGVGLSALGTFLFSLGNMVSLRHKQNQINLLTSNAWAMNYGAVILIIIILANNLDLSWDSRPVYIYSLIYLAIPGSVIGFTAYLSLVNRIGANQAAYATVLFPVVALAISSVYEDYRWSLLNILGLISVLVGNAIALKLLLPKLVKTARSKVS